MQMVPTPCTRCQKNQIGSSSHSAVLIWSKSTNGAMELDLKTTCLSPTRSGPILLLTKSLLDKVHMLLISNPEPSTQWVLSPVSFYMQALITMLISSFLTTLILLHYVTDGGFEKNVEINPQSEDYVMVSVDTYSFNVQQQRALFVF